MTIDADRFDVEGSRARLPEHLANRIDTVLAKMAGHVDAIALGYNVDTTHLGVDPHKYVTKQHAQTFCGCCGDPMWISVPQLRYTRANPSILSACALCCATLYDLAGQPETIAAMVLDPAPDNPTERS